LSFYTGIPVDDVYDANDIQAQKPSPEKVRPSFGENVVMIRKEFDHIGIAVHSIKDALPTYTDMLGGAFVDEYTVEDVGGETRVAIILHKDITIELLEPVNDQSRIARFLEEKGNGVHHVAYRVDDLELAMEMTKQQGAVFLENSIRVNKYGRRLVYLDPESTDGTMIELCEYPKRSAVGQK
jgi:methylmalonyl-CoA/ethylmalonyl-CoA epimerase